MAALEVVLHERADASRIAPARDDGRLAEVNAETGRHWRERAGMHGTARCAATTLGAGRQRGRLRRVDHGRAGFCRSAGIGDVLGGAALLSAAARERE